VLVAALVAGACSSGDDGDAGPDPTGDGSSGTTAVATYEPTSETVECDDVLAGVPTAQCGVLTVPVDRAVPSAGNVTIPYAVVPATAPEPAPDPIIYFSGGPGFPGRSAAASLVGLGIGGADRDLIVFDQRGTGASTPSLDCPEITELVWTTLGAAADPADELALGVDAAAACRARLVAEGVDLNAYDTPTTAADVEDLRVVLGIESWNLFGASYGTSVAQEVVRQHPERVRTVILDSIVPPDRPSDARTIVEVADRAIDALALGCAADPDCTVANGDIDAGLDELRAAWNADPFESAIEDPATGQARPLTITGDDAVAGLWNAMYDTTLIPLLPSLLRPLLERSPLADAVVQQLASSGIDLLTGGAEGMGNSVDCADRQHLARDPAEDVLAEQPAFASLLTLGGVRPCELWDVESVDFETNEPVDTDIPALLLGGEYDPITPPDDGRQVLDGFDEGNFVEFPGMGHGVLFVESVPCPRLVLAGFLANPEADLDLSCGITMGPPEWATG
jgi:pimeloyl-ACP methyl ester carboxylesterase